MKATARSRCTGPSVAVLGNVSLDHKSLAELRDPCSAISSVAAEIAAVNLDDAESAALAPARAPR